MINHEVQQLGNYRLLRRIGRGTFATVYLGEHHYLERPAAVKVLDIQIESGTHNAFIDEARTIAQLDHPHIVGVYEFGIEDHTPYLAMEYAPNGTLQQRETRLTFEQIVTYVKQIASALDYAHERHIIHRDVKPANLLLKNQNEVLLSDFGIAVVRPPVDALSTQQRPDASGTPIYMAPEQIRGHPCPASDQYALGVVVYEWLCGEPPFPGSSPFEVFHQHLHTPPPSLCGRIPQLPIAVEKVVLKALDKNPQQRFFRVHDFATALATAFEITQPLPPPEPPQTPQLIPIPSPAPVPAVSEPMRQRLLDKVRSFWIKGVFEQSLHGAVLMALELKMEPHAVANPWHLSVQHPDTVPQVLPEGTHITQVYDDAGSELLILGAPGAGKTTLLLALARDLLDRAEQNEHHQIPVVFNLSSWATRQLPLKDWLVRELHTKYQIPRKTGQKLVDNDQILPLLDGLDEVAPQSRTACIKVINAYRGGHGLVPLVVCSRIADYLAGTSRLLLRSAVTVQPLTQNQIDSSLAQGGASFSALRTVLRQDTTLRELVSTPLMLSILILAYHGKPVKELLKTTTFEEQQRQIFAKYIESMLTRRGPMPGQTIHWLTSLARQMRRRNQTVFYVEQIQPDWLPATQAYKYKWPAVRLPGILIGVLLSLLVNALLPNSFDMGRLIVYGFIGGYIGNLFSNAQIEMQTNRQMQTQRHMNLLLNIALSPGKSILIGLGVWLFVWLVVGDTYTIGDVLHNGGTAGFGTAVSTFLLDIFFMRLQRIYKRPEPPLRVTGVILADRASWQRWIGNGVFIGSCVGLPFGIITWYFFREHGPDYAAIFGINDGVMYWLTFVLIGTLSSSIFELIIISTRIYPTEILNWSLSSFGRSLWNKRHLMRTFLVGICFLLIFGAASSLSTFSSEWFSQHYLVTEVKPAIIFSIGLGGGLTYGLTFGIAYWLLLGLYSGLSSEFLPEDNRSEPNEGIRRSLDNGVRTGFYGGLIIGFTGVLSTVLYFGLHAGFGQVSNIGVTQGLSSGLANAFNILTIWSSSWLIVGLQATLFGGSLACIFMGGLACFRHFVLRCLLWQSNKISFDYPDFLDRAAECLLLRKVGGGYLFIHRELLDYMASLAKCRFCGHRDNRGDRRFCPVCGKPMDT